VITDLRKKARLLATMLERIRELCQGSLEKQEEIDNHSGLGRKD
jgi:hypothetical protein